MSSSSLTELSLAPVEILDVFTFGAKKKRCDGGNKEQGKMFCLSSFGKNSAISGWTGWVSLCSLGDDDLAGWLQQLHWRVKYKQTPVAVSQSVSGGLELSSLHQDGGLPEGEAGLQ